MAYVKSDYEDRSNKILSFDIKFAGFGLTNVKLVPYLFD